MCAVSYVSDYWANTVPQRYPNYPYPPIAPGAFTGTTFEWNPITRAEFEQLRADVAELKTLLLAAKKYDEATNQPECHDEDKVELIKKIAKMVGIDMKEIFPD